jgi:hypothetical protein
LDWTANPLVAAFFAVRDEHGSDSVMYALDLEHIGVVDVALSPFSLRQVALLRPAHATRRVVAQNGVFTVHPRPDKVFSNAGLKRYLIKEECTIDLMVTLDCYGINCASLFPDLDGVAKHINQDHLLD